MCYCPLVSARSLILWAFFLRLCRSCWGAGFGLNVCLVRLVGLLFGQLDGSLDTLC